MIAEVYLRSNSVPIALGRVGAKWMELVGEPIVSFDRAARSEKCRHAEQALDAYVVALRDRTRAPSER